MEPVIGIAEMLQTYGGWGVAVVFLVLLWCLYRSTNNILESRHQESIEIIASTNQTLTRCSQAMEQTVRIVTDLDHTLDDIKEQLRQNQDTLNRAIRVIERHNG